MESDGANPRQLTANAGRLNQSPCPSVDGRYIVFVSERSGTGQLWRIETDGAHPTQLTFHAPLAPSATPVCSGDGKWVFFTQAGTDSGIWKVSIDGGEPVPIDKTADIATTPAVSKDMKRLAYYDIDAAGKTRIKIISLEATAPPAWFDVATSTIQWSPGWPFAVLRKKRPRRFKYLEPANFGSATYSDHPFHQQHDSQLRSLKRWQAACHESRNRQSGCGADS